MSKVTFENNNFSQLSVSELQDGTWYTRASDKQVCCADYVNAHGKLNLIILSANGYAYSEMAGPKDMFTPYYGKITIDIN